MKFQENSFLRYFRSFKSKQEFSRKINFCLKFYIIYMHII